VKGDHAAPRHFERTLIIEPSDPVSTMDSFAPSILRPHHDGYRILPPVSSDRIYPPLQTRGFQLTLRRNSYAKVEKKPRFKLLKQSAFCGSKRDRCAGVLCDEG
jgi:hypothetical protein